MAENEELPTPATPEEPTTAQTPAVGPRLRDTVWNFRSMLAVAAASLLIGGAGGAAIVGLATGDDGSDRPRLVNIGGDGPGFRQEPFGGPYRQGPRTDD